MGRSAVEALKRKALRTVLPNPSLFNPLLGLGQLTRPLLPAKIRAQGAAPRARRRRGRRLGMPAACWCCRAACSPASRPTSTRPLARVLDRIGISLLAAPQAGCCGAVSYHLNAQEEGLDYMRRNIDAWWPYVEQGVEAIVMTASGCGVMVKEYGHLLARDPRYAEKAKRISALTKDATEILAAEREVARLSPHASRLAPRSA